MTRAPLTSTLALGMAHKNFIPLQGATPLRRQDAIYADITLAPGAAGNVVLLRRSMILGGGPQ